MISTLNNINNKSMTQTTLLFDLESTGFLRRGSSIHCIVARDLSNSSDALVWDAPRNNLDQGIEQLRRADVLIGHNIAGYDIPLIQEQYDFDFQGEVIDTLVLSRLFYPHLQERDYERRPIGLPQRRYGSHSLEAWGYRLKCFKGDFGKHDGAWKTYTPEMLDYCIQDTEVNLKIYELMLRRMQDYATA